MTATSLPSKKEILAGLSERYHATLRTHLVEKIARATQHAKELGRLALAGGLATSDVVIVHQQALTTLAASAHFNAAAKRSLARAGRFLTHALAPLESAQRAIREAKAQRAWRERNAILSRHAKALARGNRQLEREIALTGHLN